MTDNTMQRVSPETRLSAKDRMLHGAIGAIIAGLAAVAIMATVDIDYYDRQILEGKYTIFYAIVIKVILQILVGSIVSYYASHIRSKWLIFLTGACAASFLSGVGAGSGKLIGLISSNIFQPIGTAYAQDISGPSVSPDERPHIYPICLPQVSEIKQFIAGLTGIVPDTFNLYWVTVNEPNRDAAKANVDRLVQFGDRGSDRPRAFSIKTQKGFDYFAALGISLSPGDAVDRAQSLKQKYKVDSVAQQLSGIAIKYHFTINDLPTCHFQSDNP